MKIGVIQASTRTDLNQLLFEAVKQAAGNQHEIVNFGVFPQETENYSYVEVAVMISLLIETGAIDFMVSGCSSGQGMMMACNSLPGYKLVLFRHHRMPFSLVVSIMEMLLHFLWV